MFDAWTLAHIATGVVAKRIGMKPLVYIGLAVGFEALEHLVEAKLKRPESGNQCGRGFDLGSVGLCLHEAITSMPN